MRRSGEPIPCTSNEDGALRTGRWHLGNPIDEQGQEIDPWQFKDGSSLDLGRASVSRSIPEEWQLDFAGLLSPSPWSMAASSSSSSGWVQDVQFLPARVEGHTGPYFILNALRIIRCIDDARCEEVQYWKPEDNRPDKLGSTGLSRACASTRRRWATPASSALGAGAWPSSSPRTSSRPWSARASPAHDSSRCERAAAAPDCFQPGPRLPCSSDDSPDVPASI